MEVVHASAFKTEVALSSIMSIEQRTFPGDFITLDDFSDHYQRTYLLLDIDQTIVGYYMWYSMRDYSYLYSFAVDKYYQGNGYAKILLEHYLNNSRYNKHCLHVRSDNEVAINLYKSFGYYIVGELIENFYEDGKPAITMFRDNEV